MGYNLREPSFEALITTIPYRWDKQWWIGATVHGSHSEHNWGNWTWDIDGSELQW